MAPHWRRQRKERYDCGHSTKESTLLSPVTGSCDECQREYDAVFDLKDSVEYKMLTTEDQESLNAANAFATMSAGLRFSSDSDDPLPRPPDGFPYHSRVLRPFGDGQKPPPFKFSSVTDRRDELTRRCDELEKLVERISGKLVREFKAKFFAVIGQKKMVSTSGSAIELLIPDEMREYSVVKTGLQHICLE